MNALPASIESYLTEAGFTPTELFVLRKLLDEDAMSLRQMAAKTGKSTGVLDQAMKKLLRRNIVRRESINDGFKYTIVSIHAIAQWVQRDMEEKRDMLERRHQNFETFIRSLEQDQKRPEMQFYEGEDGIKQAYIRLLDHGKEMLHFFPVTAASEEDPLSAFRAEYFRRRRKCGIFARVITNDTPHGRRFASRDPYEYRKTMLVPEEKFPVDFEKIITGNLVACFNHKDQRACFLNYPDLAATERSFFERLWRQQEEANRHPAEAAGSAAPTGPRLPLSERARIALRDFFCSRSSLITLAAFALLSAAITYGLYRQNVYLNTQRIRERAMSIASTGALQFDPRDLDQLHTAEDIKKPEYAKVIGKLNEIRDRNGMVRYIYILRPTQKDKIFEFVADADSIDPFLKVDSNHDGKIDKLDENVAPGQEYPMNDMVTQDGDWYTKSNASPSPSTDQWGTWLSGFEPIKNAQGDTIAVLGADIDASEVNRLTTLNFNSLLYFLGFIFLFVLIRLIGFHQSLFGELVEALKLKKMLKWLPVLALFAAVITFGLYRYTDFLNVQRVRERAMAIASTAASQFDMNDVEQIHTKVDIKKPEYTKLVQQLRKIRSENENVKYVYIHRPSGIPQTPWEVVADADYGSPYVDYNGDGKIEEDEQCILPGQIYPHVDPYFKNILEGPFVVPVKDEWGDYFDASAPMFDTHGKAVAALYVDIDVQQLRDLTAHTFSPMAVFLGLFALFVIIQLAIIHKQFLAEAIKIPNVRSFLLSLPVLAVLAALVTYGLYCQNIYLNTQRIRERVMSIVSTGALQFDARDLDQLHTIADISKPEYAKVIKILNEIRKQNSDVRNAYIFRERSDKKSSEFVADADSLDPLTVRDVNGDGVIDEADHLSPPGEVYKADPNDIVGLPSDPYASPRPVTDQWGTYFYGNAVIKNSSGQMAGILGVDIDASDLSQLTAVSFNYVYYYLCCLSLFMIIRLVAFHKALHWIHRVKRRLLPVGFWGRY